jgi:hypothetical protein
LGLPHRSTEGEWYEEVFLSNATICISNTWRLNRDPEDYDENATHFDPAWHLDAKEGGRVTNVGNASVDMLPTTRFEST